MAYFLIKEFITKYIKFKLLKIASTGIVIYEEKELWSLVIFFAILFGEA